MSSLGSILTTARTALQAHQKATQVGAHNISNALTEGYTRQRVEMTAGRPVHTPQGWTGTGVRIVDISRTRDALLDGIYRQESGNAAGYRLRQEMLGQVEAALGEPTDQGLGATLDAFWASWSDLANSPADENARSLVRERGDQLAGHLNRLGHGVGELRSQTRQRLADGISEVNRLSTTIADLNRRIVSAEADGTTASDLRDARDLALDEMAALAPIQVAERQNGSIGVTIGGISVVDDTSVQQLRVQNAGGALEVVTEGGRTVQEAGGAIDAMLDLLNTEIPALAAKLDDLARAVVDRVNALHRSGVNPNGDTGIDFFAVPTGDVADITAGTIALAAEIEADPLAIAAGTGDGAGAYRAGANDVALQLAQLRDSPDATYLGGRTPGEYYTGLVTDLGHAIANARDGASVHDTLAAQADVRRASVSGVSTDEEMVRLIQNQAAYTAAAKVITTVDEMMQTVLNLV